METIRLEEVNGEMRIDSRLYSEGIGIQHKSFMSNVFRIYKQKFMERGDCPLYTCKTIGRGRPTRYVKLNEAQTELALQIARNTRKMMAFMEVIEASFGVTFNELEAGVKEEAPAVSAPKPVPAEAISVEEIDGELRLDSRLYCRRLDIDHGGFMTNIVKKYASNIKAFGQLHFKNGVVEKLKGGGNPQQYALLNEDQVYFAITLNRNSDKAIQFKIELVKVFSKAREALSSFGDDPVMAAMAQTMAIRKQQLELIEKQKEMAVRQEKFADDLQDVKNIYTTGHMAIIGKANLLGFSMPHEEARRLGVIAASLSRRQGYPIYDVPHPVFARINTYHPDILDQVFDGYVPPSNGPEQMSLLEDRDGGEPTCN